MKEGKINQSIFRSNYCFLQPIIVLGTAKISLREQLEPPFHFELSFFLYSFPLPSFRFLRRPFCWMWTNVCSSIRSFSLLFSESRNEAADWRRGNGFRRWYPVTHQDHHQLDQLLTRSYVVVEVTFSIQIDDGFTSQVIALLSSIILILFSPLCVFVLDRFHAANLLVISLAPLYHSLSPPPSLSLFFLLSLSFFSSYIVGHSPGEAQRFELWNNIV